MTGARPYLLEVSEVLWPADDEPRKATGRNARPRTLLAVPSARTPSLLLPSGRAAAAAAVRAYGGHGTLRNRSRTRATAALFSLGLGRLAFRDTLTVSDGEKSISAELSRILGRGVQVAVRGGPARANRKPVLAVLDDDGTLLAFAKVGTTALARDLVQVEGAALERLAPVLHSGVRAPRVLHQGSWRDMSLLVQEALPAASGQPVTDRRLMDAAAQLCRALGTTSASWGTSEHADVVRNRLARSPESTLTRDLAAAVAALSADRLPLELGCWHGDWTAWNCAAAGDRVLVWDWERFATGVPVGFDVLHYGLQSELARAAGPSVALAKALLREAPDRLAPLGVSPDAARVTALAYLIEIATRYHADGQADAGARVGGVGSWLLPVITEAAADLASSRGASAT
jgi:hypothetical protein